MPAGWTAAVAARLSTGLKSMHGPQTRDHSGFTWTPTALYLLSIVAAIFLSLSLLTGLLGINVGGIPGSESRWGFALVSVVLAAIAVGLVAWFK